MTIDEMKKIEWVVPWSGGKDSTATIILMHENNIPIKRITHTLMMFDENTPATLEIQNQFRNKAIQCFKEWGYTVEILKSRRTAWDLANVVYRRSKYEIRNGTKYGVAAFSRGFCGFEKYKHTTQTDEFVMLGYAADEINRLQRLEKGNRASILAELNITEAKALEICRNYDLLSPLYDLGFLRDGCFFCPNYAKAEREYVRTKEPELYKKILEIIHLTDAKVLDTFANNYPNEWLRDYFKETRKL